MEFWRNWMKFRGVLKFSNKTLKKSLFWKTNYFSSASRPPRSNPIKLKFYTLVINIQREKVKTFRGYLHHPDIIPQGLQTEWTVLVPRIQMRVSITKILDLFWRITFDKRAERGTKASLRKQFRSHKKILSQHELEGS